MKRFFKGWMIGALWCLMSFPVSSLAETPVSENASELVTLLKEQNSKLSGDLRHIQREIAALRADLEKPGFRDIFSGIGYIFGFFGVAAYVASRRRG
jgi:nickel transport protein